MTWGGEPLWVNLSWRRVGDNQVRCSLIDIHQRKCAEQAAEENFTRYLQVTEDSPTCIIITRDQKIVYTNPAFHHFSGYTAEDLAGKDLLSFLHAADRPDFFSLLANPDKSGGKTSKLEYRFLSKTGEIRLAAAFFFSIHQKGETPQLVNLVDVTEKEQFKERIEQDNERRRGIISTVAHAPLADHGILKSPHRRPQDVRGDR